MERWYLHPYSDTERDILTLRLISFLNKCCMYTTRCLCIGNYISLLCINTLRCNKLCFKNRSIVINDSTMKVLHIFIHPIPFTLSASNEESLARSGGSNSPIFSLFTGNWRNVSCFFPRQEKKNVNKISTSSRDFFYFNLFVWTISTARKRSNSVLQWNAPSERHFRKKFFSFFSLIFADEIPNFVFSFFFWDVIF